jgi:cell shape-determining protein MreD
MLFKGNITRWEIVGFFDLELVIIILAFLITYCSLQGAGIFAFSLGLLIDIFSTGPLGLLTFLYLVSFLLIVFGSNLFDCRAQVGLSILIFLVVLFKDILQMLMMISFSLGSPISIKWFLAIITSAMFSGLLAPMIFAVLKMGLRFILKDAQWHV